MYTGVYRVWFDFVSFFFVFFFFKQKTAYEMRISDWSSDVCSSDLTPEGLVQAGAEQRAAAKPLVQALRGRVEDLAQGRIALVPRRRVAADAGAEQVVVEEAIGGIGDRSLPARLLQRNVRPHERPQADREPGQQQATQRFVWGKSVAGRVD